MTIKVDLPSLAPQSVMILQAVGENFSRSSQTVCDPPGFPARTV